MTCWSWTRCSTGYPEGGRSCVSARTSAGCGWPSAAERARSSLTPSATVAKPPAACSGSAFPPRTSAACCTQTSGRRMPRFCLNNSTEPRARARARPATLIKPHIERFNDILRQRLARFVRRTLSFSKNDEMHEICLLLFLHQHNRRIQIMLNN